MIWSNGFEPKSSMLQITPENLYSGQLSFNHYSQLKILCRAMIDEHTIKHFRLFLKTLGNFRDHYESVLGYKGFLLYLWEVSLHLETRSWVYYLIQEQYWDIRQTSSYYFLFWRSYNSELGYKQFDRYKSRTMNYLQLKSSLLSPEHQLAHL